MQLTQAMTPIAAKAPAGQRAEKARAHISSFDVLRVIAAIAVVWIHSVDSGPLGETAIWCRFAVPAFTSLSVFLLAQSVMQKSPASVIRYAPTRAWTIYRLFLIWNALYFVARLVKHYMLGGGHAIPLTISSILIVGLEGHLWYLPFLAILGVALVLPLRGLLELKWRLAILATVALALAGLLAGHLATLIQVDKAHRPLTYFEFLALSTFPAALLILPIAWLWNQRNATGFGYPCAAISFVVGASCLVTSRNGGCSNLWHNLAGACFVLAAVGCAGARLPERVRHLGTLAFPVYVLHPLLIDGLRPICARLGVVRSATADVTLFTVGVCGSFLIAHLLSANRWLSWSISTRPIRHNDVREQRTRRF
jgi:peptidoglycan/LPS O-acetylase OafA/YrhL